MGAESSVQRDGKSQEDASASASASAGELNAEVKVLQEGDSVLDSKPLQKNGQISSLSSLNGHSEDNTLAEVGQPDGVSVPQKEEAPETMDTIQDEVTPQANGEKVDKESPGANDISAVEEKAAEEKPDDASEVGFKKIFRFVGFKFTLKKDKSEEKDPVKLLTVRDKEGEEVSGADEPTKEEEATTEEEKGTAEEKETDKEAGEAEVTKDSDKSETTDAPSEAAAAAAAAAAETSDEAVKEEGAEKEGETTPPSQETTLSPFRKFFSGGLFSNLRKKASIKKTKEEEEKEEAGEEETVKTEETATAAEEKEETAVTEQDTKEEAPEAPVEEKSEPKEEAPTSPEEVKPEATPEGEVIAETSAPTETVVNETKQEEPKDEASAEEEKAPVEVTTEAELLSSQEKAKPQGSPLKKLFTGAGLKKLSTKKQKNKKESESKLTESGEQASEQLQSSTDSSEPPKAESGPSSPEESGEHAIAVEVTQNESSQETDGEVASDGEKKKDGIIAWSSFKKLVTPKKRVKRSSESEDEATGEKPAQSATLSSSESAPLADESVKEEAKEEKPAEEEPKTENTDKLVSSTEEPKKKMDTSVSWEALMCMGGPKKRTRKTSDSDDDDETKIEEEVPAVEEDQEGKTEDTIVASQNTESEGEGVSSPEPVNSPPERESTWDTLKRIVLSKNRPKVEEKPEEHADQVQSDSEAPKDESSFSLRKFFPGRRKKKAEKQASTDQGSGEEDSDTPAVVPLSEYDKPEAGEEAPAEQAAVQAKVSAEDRSPSWIPAGVEDDKHDQLSDIPEEAENAATPKSVDTDIVEDDTEEHAVPPKTFGRTGRRLSTAEVKPVDPAPAAATTPVPQGPQSESADEIVSGIEAQISEIPPQTSVAVESVPVEVASEKTEHEPPTENAKSTSNTILEPHARNEAMAICTGLGTKEIAKVALEKPVVPVAECVTVIRDALGTEVSMEEKVALAEEAAVTEDAVLNAQVHQVDTTELEPAVESADGGDVDIQAASEGYEPEIEKVGIVSTVLEESEVIQPTTMSENSPKAVIIDPISPTAETAVCAQSVQISEVTIVNKEVKMDMEPLAAEEVNTPVKEVVQTVTEEMSSTICGTSKTTMSEETEPDIPVILPSEEVPVITETVVLVAPLSLDADQVATSERLVMENASVSETVGVEPVQVQETKEQVEQASEIESQSMVIAQAVIQDAVDKVLEPKKPATPTSTIPTPVQAVATTEKEIDVTPEVPIVTETPVAVVCEKPPQQLCVATEVFDAIPLEVTGNLEEEKKKPEEKLKKAVEVNVSEQTVIVEEVVEEIEQVKKEECKEDQKPENKETAEDAKSEDKENVHEIHMPIQVVLQTAQVLEEPSVEEEAVEEFDSSSPGTQDSSAAAKSPTIENKLPVLSEEPQGADSEELTDAAASQLETESTSNTTKCAEVMAQVIEVIEEAVKEIEPVSTEITAAS